MEKLDWREMLKQNIEGAETEGRAAYARGFDKTFGGSIARLSGLLQDEPGFDEFIAEVKAMLEPKLGDTVYRYASSNRFYAGTIVSFDRGWAVFEDDGRAPVAGLRWSPMRMRWEYFA